MTKTRYTEEDHKRAFLLWRQGKSYREIASEEGLPSKETIHRWSKPDYDCPFDGEWHGYKEKHSEIVSEALKDVEEDMPDLVDRERQRLEFLFQIERQITDIMESGELQPPKTLKDAVDLLSEVYNQQRLIQGEATSITEERGSQGNINLSRIAKQLNVDNFQEVVHAAEDQIMEGDPDGEE